uniref:Uncharacterized protein n=1 Tax=viral metagenome TaxID=1070528 RepID=A0A6C0C9T5_9ZZZZ
MLRMFIIKLLLILMEKSHVDNQITMDDPISEIVDVELRNSFDDISIEPNFEINKMVILKYVSKIINNELEICSMENHNIECHFDGSIGNNCTICNTKICSVRGCIKEMNGCFLACSTSGITDDCVKDHIIFCYTCSHTNLSPLGNLSDFYKQYSAKKVHRNVNKSKSMIENIADKIAIGWTISSTANHSCVTQLFAVQNRCLECFIEYIYVPKNGTLIHKNSKCNYTLPHYFLCENCTSKLMPFFYERTVYTYFKKTLSSPLAQMLISYL